MADIIAVVAFAFGANLRPSSTGLLNSSAITITDHDATPPPMHDITQYRCVVRETQGCVPIIRRVWK
jgi:hypothetical protein